MHPRDPRDARASHGHAASCIAQTGPWTQNHLTSTGKQYYESEHTRAIKLDNGDLMIIVGKTSSNSGWGGFAYNGYTILINCDQLAPQSYTAKRRLVVTSHTTYNGKRKESSDFPFTAAHEISFCPKGFYQGAQNVWPAFRGTFRMFKV